MRLFIDTNILLRFFEYSDDDLEQLKKLSAAIQEGVITVFLPEQVRNEFERRREGVLKKAIKEVADKKINETFPAPFQSYDEYGKIRDAINAFNIAKNDLLKQVRSHAQEQNLLADLVVKEIFRGATAIPMDQTCVDRAERRVALGNPPGKRGEFGDAVIWEHLLEHVETDPSEISFFVVSNDRDFTSELEPSVASAFLSREWRAAKSSELVVYTHLSHFFNENFPDIKLAREMERLRAVEQLIYAGSFKTTHAAVGLLAQYDNFSDNEVQNLVSAAISNNQIYWLADDDDVREFFLKLINKRETILTAEALEIFKSIFLKEEIEDEMPF